MFKLRRNTALVILALLIALPAMGSAAPEIETFETALATDKELIAQVNDLKKNAYAKQQQSESLVLSTECGIGGCSTYSLVITRFMQKNSSAQSLGVMGVVHYNSLTKRAVLKRVLSRTEADELINP